MRNLLAILGRLSVTLVMVAMAAVVGWQLWIYYMDAPWTRDGRVRADVVQVAPDVSGLVSEVLVHDNDTVHVGQILFRIDPVRYELALQVAEAVLASKTAAAQEAQREMKRYRSLSNLSVSEEAQQQRAAADQIATAAYQQALVERNLAQLNLERTAVKATVNGTITNFGMRPGDYVTTGEGVAALVDSDSFHVDGYFEETKLPRIRIGDRALVHLMGQDADIIGHVDSVAAGIADRERTLSSSLLADVNPTFTWVRLAQRVPVRITLDHVPPQVELVAGRTATVEVLPQQAAAQAAK
ncbi:efflux RND transporter periplasmic adaptor subunit [Limobrevibacterium gyesilva]|uniref:HlyD family secretion protein n=1 Tax=Limobrevibacterium gyesilva TaxID=2991712 RepID=A0AA41YKL9_9PROT|nr:HlyD family secretion protein [Limobrevibacterium gyesilva]MCW3475559.1 HlyD family secretion protein [Limobrevibacterium gyesilva]